MKVTAAFFLSAVVASTAASGLPSDSGEEIKRPGSALRASSEQRRVYRVDTNAIARRDPNSNTVRYVTLREWTQEDWKRAQDKQMAQEQELQSSSQSSSQLVVPAPSEGQTTKVQKVKNFLLSRTIRRTCKFAVGMGAASIVAVGAAMYLAATPECAEGLFTPDQIAWLNTNREHVMSYLQSVSLPSSPHAIAQYLKDNIGKISEISTPSVDWNGMLEGIKSKIPEMPAIPEMPEMPSMPKFDWSQFELPTMPAMPNIPIAGETIKQYLTPITESVSKTAIAVCEHENVKPIIDFLNFNKEFIAGSVAIAILSATTVYGAVVTRGGVEGHLMPDYTILEDEVDSEKPQQPEQLEQSEQTGQSEVISNQPQAVQQPVVEESKEESPDEDQQQQDKETEEETKQDTPEDEEDQHGQVAEVEEKEESNSVEEESSESNSSESTTEGNTSAEEETNEQEADTADQGQDQGQEPDAAGVEEEVQREPSPEY